MTGGLLSIFALSAREWGHSQLERWGHTAWIDEVFSPADRPEHCQTDSDQKGLSHSCLVEFHRGWFMPRKTGLSPKLDRLTRRSFLYKFIFVG